VGWIIAASIIVILLSPLFIPIVFRARWDDEHREWSAFIGPLKIAPDTMELLAKYKAIAIKITRPFVILFKAIFWVIKKIVALIVIISLWISWPFRRLVAFIKSKKTNKEKKKIIEEKIEDSSEESKAIDSSEVSSDYSVSSEESEELYVEEDDQVDTSEQPESEEDLYEEDEEKSQNKESKRKNPFYSLLESFNSFINRFLKFGTNYSKTSEKINKGVELYEAYSPLGKKVLGRIFKFISGCFKVVKFKTFKAHLRTGGDPATLGVLLGWYHAICGSISPTLSKNLIFDPDFDSEEITLNGSLNIAVVIWPYKIIVPILRLLVTMPWFALIKVYRTQKKKSS
jgi:hypothetical protein